MLRARGRIKFSVCGEFLGIIAIKWPASWNFPHTRVGAKLASTWLDFQRIVVPTSSAHPTREHDHALVAPQAVRAPRGAARPPRAARRRSKTRAAAVAPKIVTASSNAPIGGDKKKGARGEEAFRLQALGKNPIVERRAGCMDVIPGDYRIGGVLLGVATFLGPVCHLWTQFGIHGFLGAFLAFQASRVRFRFSDTDLDVVFIEPGADDSTALDVDTESSGDNKLQGGGANKWSFDSVTNWEFWFPGFPVLVYYKENQTRPEGQPHFFPIIMDGKKLYETMLAKMPESVNKKPLVSEWNLDTAFESTALGRKIKESLSEEQLKQLKDTTGFPGLDK